MLFKVVIICICGVSLSRAVKDEPTSSTRCKYLHVIRVYMQILLKIEMLRCRVNVGCGPAEERVLLTGLHAVADIYCECCKTTLGWKYVRLV